MKNLLVCLLVWAVGCAQVISSPLVKVEKQTKSENDAGEIVISVWRGSGFFVSENGVFITAEHVIQGYSKVFVYTHDRPLFAREARVLVTDRDADLAVLYVPRMRSRFLRFCPSMEVAQEVTAYAWRYDNPERTAGLFLGALYAGRFLALLLVGPGFSGGPVYDEAGECVVGVVSQMRVDEDDGQTYSIFTRPEASADIMDVLHRLAPESVEDL